jgi:hypothetical protein
MGIEIVEALPGMEVGKGFDTVTSDVKVSRAVTGSIRASPAATGQSAQE